MPLFVNWKNIVFIFCISLLKILVPILSYAEESPKNLIPLNVIYDVMPVPLIEHSSIELTNGKFLLVGGYDTEWDNFFQRNNRYYSKDAQIITIDQHRSIKPSSVAVEGSDPMVRPKLFKLNNGNVLILQRLLGQYIQPTPIKENFFYIFDSTKNTIKKFLLTGPLPFFPRKLTPIGNNQFLILDGGCGSGHSFTPALKPMILNAVTGATEIIESDSFKVDCEIDFRTEGQLLPNKNEAVILKTELYSGSGINVYKYNKIEKKIVFEGKFEINGDFLYELETSLALKDGRIIALVHLRSPKNYETIATRIVEYKHEQKSLEFLDVEIGKWRSQLEQIVELKDGRILLSGGSGSSGGSPFKVIELNRNTVWSGEFQLWGHINTLKGYSLNQLTNGELILLGGRYGDPIHKASNVAQFYKLIDF